MGSDNTDDDLITTLSGQTAGRWSYATFSGSVCVLDLDERWIERRPGKPGLFESGGTANLRLDGERIDVVSVLDITVGAPAMLVVDIRHDGVKTLRLSTPVLSIRREDCT